jgi:uncharacterized protein GlcG (DUF336 family)
MKIRSYAISAGAVIVVLAAMPANAACRDLPNHQALQRALKASVKASGGPANGGFELNMWASIVDRDGIVCEVAFSGANRGAQWPGSRVISAQKANTANAFSLDGLALSTANLFSAVQPGRSLFGLQESNPVDTAVAYGGQAASYGTADDPMKGRRIGGVSPKKDDGIIYDIDAQGASASGFGHTRCGGTEPAVAAEIGAGG